MSVAEQRLSTPGETFPHVCNFIFVQGCFGASHSLSCSAAVCVGFLKFDVCSSTIEAEEDCHAYNAIAYSAINSGVYMTYASLHILV